jgi:hypothetical protein
MSGQQHGITYENFIMSAKYPGAMTKYRNPSAAVFDIDKDFDKRWGCPVSVKVTGNNTLCLADSRAFVAVGEWLDRNDLDGYILEVGHWEQEDHWKVYHRHETFHISSEMHAEIVGSVTPEECSHIHKGIALNKFGKYHFDHARIWAKVEIEKLQPNLGILTLNPKIDASGKVRRLQCSVTLTALRELVDHYPAWQDGIQYNRRETMTNVGSSGLPVKFISLPRSLSGNLRKSDELDQLIALV